MGAGISKSCSGGPESHWKISVSGSPAQCVSKESDAVSAALCQGYLNHLLMSRDLQGCMQRCWEILRGWEWNVSWVQARSIPSSLYYPQDQSLAPNPHSPQVSLKILLFINLIWAFSGFPSIIWKICILPIHTCDNKFGSITKDFPPIVPQWFNSFQKPYTKLPSWSCR